MAQCEDRAADLVSRLEVETIDSCCTDGEKVVSQDHRVAVLEAKLFELLQVPTTSQADVVSMVSLSTGAGKRDCAADILIKHNDQFVRDATNTATNKNKPTDQKLRKVRVSVYLTGVLRDFVMIFGVHFIGGATRLTQSD